MAVPSIGSRLPHRRDRAFLRRVGLSISNRYVPEIERLEREFTPAGVHFWSVYRILRTHRK